MDRIYLALLIFSPQTYIRPHVKARGVAVPRAILQAHEHGQVINKYDINRSILTFLIRSILVLISLTENAPAQIRGNDKLDANARGEWERWRPVPLSDHELDFQAQWSHGGPLELEELKTSGIDLPQ